MNKLYFLFLFFIVACFDFKEGTETIDNPNTPDFPAYRTTVYVDGTQASTTYNPDGTREKPYKSINAALDHFRNSSYFINNPDISKSILLLSDINITINQNENIVIHNFSNLTISSEGDDTNTIKIINKTYSDFFTITNSSDIIISKIEFVLEQNLNNKYLFNFTDSSINFTYNKVLAVNTDPVQTHMAANNNHVINITNTQFLFVRDDEYSNSLISLQTNDSATINFINNTRIEDYDFFISSYENSIINFKDNTFRDDSIDDNSDINKNITMNLSIGSSINFINNSYLKKYIFQTVALGNTKLDFTNNKLLSDTPLSFKIEYKDNDNIKFNNNIFKNISYAIINSVKIHNHNNNTQNLKLEIKDNTIINQSLVLELYLNNPNTNSSVEIENNMIYDDAVNATPVLDYALKIIGEIILSPGITAANLININNNYLYSKETTTSYFGHSFFYQLYKGSYYNELFTPSCTSMYAQNANKFCHYQDTGNTIIKGFQQCKDTTFNSYTNFTTGKQPNYFPCSNYCFKNTGSYQCNDVQ